MTVMSNQTRLRKHPRRKEAANRKLWLILPLLLMAACGGSEDATTSEENRILKMVFQKERPGDGYMVVMERTANEHLTDWDDDSGKNQKWLLESGFPQELFSKLVENNLRKVRIGLQSDQKAGYFVDSDSSFLRRYWHDSSGWNWEKMRCDRPKAMSIAGLSRPVCDKNKSLVLVFISQLRSEMDGEGYVILYKYRGDELKELKRKIVWIS